jgi:DNA repair exonuclease SbcCD nuclease subunit
MMHFGMEGQDKEKKGIKLNDDFELLKRKINYLALGHFHKMYRLPIRR